MVAMPINLATAGSIKEEDCGSGQSRGKKILSPK
jgi:hypothetical protein